MESVTQLRLEVANLRRYFADVARRLQGEGDIRVSETTDLAVMLLFIESKRPGANRNTIRFIESIVTVHRVLANVAYLAESLSVPHVPDDGEEVVMGSGETLLNLSINVDDMLRMANKFLELLEEQSLGDMPDEGNGSN